MTALAVAPLAQRLLDHITTMWPDGPADPLPTRRLILAGEPRGVAWDCEHVAVALDGIGWGQGMDLGSLSMRTGQPLHNAVRHALLAVSIVRCTPTGATTDGPTDDELNAAGVAFMHDAGTLSQLTVQFLTGDALVGDLDAVVQLNAVEPIGPSGGFHGIEQTIAISVMDTVS